MELDVEEKKVTGARGGGERGEVEEMDIKHTRMPVCTPA